MLGVAIVTSVILQNVSDIFQIELRKVHARCVIAKIQRFALTERRNNMGLDNGIILKVKNKLDLEDWEVKPDYVHISFDEWGTGWEEGKWYVYDICYWRKCWGLRGDILDILGGNDEGGYYEIDTPAQLEQIQDTIIDYLKHPDMWECAIWSLEDMAESLAFDIIRLSWLINYMWKHKGEPFEIEFYDSY